VPGIWTSLTFHHRSISWPIDRVFRIPLVISWRPELTALLTAFPWAAMLIFIVGIAHAEAFVLHLTSTATSKRQKGRITTYPLLTTWRFHYRRLRIATEATMFAGNRLRFHTVVCHGVPLCGAGAAQLALMRHCDVHHAPPRSRLWAHLDANLNPLRWPRAIALI